MAVRLKVLAGTSLFPHASTTVPRHLLSAGRSSPNGRFGSPDIRCSEYCLAPVNYPSLSASRNPISHQRAPYRIPHYEAAGGQPEKRLGTKATMREEDKKKHEQPSWI